MQALRDNLPSSDPDVTERRGLFKDIFTQLKAAGVSVPELQLAWDFTTGSQTSLTSAMTYMRDDAMKRIGQGTRYLLTSPLNHVSHYNTSPTSLRACVQHH